MSPRVQSDSAGDRFADPRHGVAVCMVPLVRAAMFTAVVIGGDLGLLMSSDQPAAARAGVLFADTLWIEGEQPTKHSMNRHPWWYDQVKTELLSGGDFISNFSDKKPGEASYTVTIPAAGEYAFWVRANPTAVKLEYRLDSGKKAGQWTAIPIEKQAVDTQNIAADGGIDLRFLAWCEVGRLKLVKGEHTLRFRMDSDNNHHGSLDCFVLTTEDFTPQGKLRPDEIAAARGAAAAGDNGWIAFDPPVEPDARGSITDLRFLNEATAGDNGRIVARDGRFVHSRTNQPVRFWAVNGGAGQTPAELQKEMRQLARYGVNLVRAHGGVFTGEGQVDHDKVKHAREIVAAAKREGIYSHFSIYFPLWLTPAADSPWLRGYNGGQHPFAVHFFSKEFQDRYREWWRTLLTTPDPETGKRLVDDPAVFGVELVNEDSFFFWTFNPSNLPAAQLEQLEARFGTWAIARYGSIPKALSSWNNLTDARDVPAEGRLGFRPLWNLFSERSPRDQATAEFLVELQRTFYREQIGFLRSLGFEGLITCSNWVTASPEVLGPLEKYSYTVGDFIDRHGYFGCRNRGEAAEWLVRDGHTFVQRSALRFEDEEPGDGRAFVHPAMDPSYNGLPSMISETTWNRPNRYRSEAPLYFAVYGALQDTDAIVHFAYDTYRWQVKPGYFMQPWTLMSPAMAGQFPAAALIYRQGLVREGDLMARVQLPVSELYALKGTPLPQDAALDELRVRDLPAGGQVKPGQVIDPLVHYVGRTNVEFVGAPGDEPAAKDSPAKTSAKPAPKPAGKPNAKSKSQSSAAGGTSTGTRVEDLSPWISRSQQFVRSQTGELSLDYGRGLLEINAPAVQGVSGHLGARGRVELKDLSVESELELGHIVVVSLDGQPLAKSSKMLLQVMSEEKATGFSATPVGGREMRINSIGQDPWRFRELSGQVELKRSDADQLRVTALDELGRPAEDIGSASTIQLRPGTLYYLVAKP